MGASGVPEDVKERVARLRPFVNRHLAHLDEVREQAKRNIQAVDTGSAEPIAIAPIEEIYECESPT